MKIKTFCDEHITTYKIAMNNLNIMLDFNGKYMSKEDINNIDVIFLTHEHLDHCMSLLNYDLVKHLKKDVKIFSTETTKLLISHIFEKYMTKNGYNKEPYEYITNLVKNINICRFKKPFIFKGLNITLFRSGHTFGSSMVYLKSKDYSLLYTGDIDYVENDENRMYDLPYGIDIDYLIADGTNLFDKDYKGVTINRVRDFINRRKPGDIVKYFAKGEKAVLYALTLANKLNNAIYFYTEYMRWYVELLYKQGYNIFVPNKIFFDNQFQDPMILNNNVHVKFTSDSTKYNIDYQLSLHITKSNFIKMIEEHFNYRPKKIFIGHYDKCKLNELLIDNSNDELEGNNEIRLDYELGLENVILLKTGENDG